MLYVLVLIKELKGAATLLCLCYFHIFVSRRAYVSHLVKYFKPTLEIIIALTVAL